VSDVPPPPGYEAALDRALSPPAPRVHHDVLHGRDVVIDAALGQRVDAKHRLANETRRLVEAVAMLDAEECDPADLEALADSVAEVADTCDPLPNLMKYGGAAVGPPVASALDERSPISGRGNAIAPPMVVEFDGERTTAWATYGPAYEGPPFHVHGGWVIAAFDELLGVAQVASGRPGMTGTLTIRLSRPTPIGRRIDYEGWVERVEGRKTFTRGVARLDGEVLAEAEGIFIAPRNWLPDFEDGAS
jgi:hypothetical protein